MSGRLLSRAIQSFLQRSLLFTEKRVKCNGATYISTANKFARRPPRIIRASNNITSLNISVPDFQTPIRDLIQLAGRIPRIEACLVEPNSPNSDNVSGTTLRA